MQTIYYLLYIISNCTLLSNSLINSEPIVDLENLAPVIIILFSQEQSNQVQSRRNVASRIYVLSYKWLFDDDMVSSQTWTVLTNQHAFDRVSNSTNHLGYPSNRITKPTAMVTHGRSDRSEENVKSVINTRF